jgi:hypothetical protein
MRRSRFEELVSTGCLWFTRLECLQDKFEGAIPKANLKPSTELVAREWPHTAQGLNGPQVIAELFAEAVESAKPRHLINCWYLGDDESNEMWNAYGSDPGSVAIRTHAGAVAKALHHAGSVLECFAGIVNYIDHENQDVAMDHFLGPFFAKGHAFGFENELRFLTHTPEPIERGLKIEVDVNRLCEQVFVRTDDKEQGVARTRAVLASHGIYCDVVESRIAGQR